MKTLRIAAALAAGILAGTAALAQSNDPAAGTNPTGMNGAGTPGSGLGGAGTGGSGPASPGTAPDTTGVANPMNPAPDAGPAMKAKPGMMMAPEPPK